MQTSLYNFTASVLLFTLSLQVPVRTLWDL